MIMRKETLVFLTSLAIIFIIGYVNMTMVPENPFDLNDIAKIEEANKPVNLDEDVAQIIEGDMADLKKNDLVEILEQIDKSDITANPPVGDTELAEDESDYVILGDITDILNNDSVEASSDGILNTLNINFANFKLNRDKSNMDVIDHLENTISNESISSETKSQFEGLLLNKSEYVQTENSIEMMLQSKGYNETIVIVDADAIKVVTNDPIEQADATKIKDVIVSETDYEPAQIKIVKFDNIDL
ncbi:SpoIIIAH-like family protein [Sedimentibacter hydroxybenzoicus DSM 7310]|uniref:SpoIIIAH-like family protein n=1 Tax=Sedimentibacter hydroxybenzoicus DSM 7310 TaxID=1123245 RepID=A0A974BI34_SEDHY|nr:SpoIIIAH-like family protein [Sedimentibacter hydroxybenzoicus]NYB73513.1 SpoIIIAH-like family protein [Sedimentibacter hydroxybenzoicus DSM 7310]